jgi:heme/copper-type cytochrome/quinol oxidase subunit 2
MIDEMHGMMIGMTLGMIAGLLTATIYLIPTGDFLFGVISGSIVGLFFGVPFGRLGGHLGIVEGVVAGPMGGMMGAMLGQMIRPFSIEVFMPFFIFIFLITLLGLSYAVHCGVSCCGVKAKKPAPVNGTFTALWAISAIVLLGASVLLSFSIAEASPVSQSSVDVKLPAFLQQASQEVRAETVMKDGYQEIEMSIANSAYSPNVIVVKKGIPLRINVKAEETAGCGSEIVIPDFKIRKIIGPGTTGVIELTPNEAGEFKFHCSMDMAKGKLVVQ